MQQIQRKYGAFLLLLTLSWSPVVPVKKLIIKPNEEIKWMSIEKAVELSKTNPKKIYIDFFTNWCGWCRKMDKEAFTNAKVIHEMNKNYYAVKFNAEGKDAITINNQVYTYSSAQNIHTYTLAMLDGQLGYPTAVILGEKGQKITAIPGYQEAPMLVEILSYFGNNNHLKQSFEDYQKSVKQ